MPSSREVLEGAAWLLQHFPHANDIYYNHEGWRIYTTGTVTTTEVFDCVMRRDLQATVNMSMTGLCLLPLNPVEKGWIRFPRHFIQSPHILRWLNKAAWAVNQMSDLRYVAPGSPVKEEWYGRSDFSDWVLSSPIENQDRTLLKAAMDVFKTKFNKVHFHLTTWIPRDFLEDWGSQEFNMAPLGPAVPVTQPPVEPVAIKASVTVEEQLPPDLRGLLKPQGMTAQERRQAHSRAVLQDMLTRTSPPRYK